MDLRDEKELGNNQHKIRESYRTLQWTSFLAADRRASKELCTEPNTWYPAHAAEKIRKMC